MAAINALDLPSFSSFKDPSLVPLLEDPMEAPIEETFVTKKDSSAM